MAVSILLVVAGCAPGGRALGKRGPLVVMTTDRLLKEGSFEECVYRQVQGGVRLEEALKDCARLTPPPDQRSIVSALELIGRNRPGVAQVECVEGFANPKAAGHSADYEAAKAAAIHIWAARMFAADKELAPSASAYLMEEATKLQELEKNLTDEEKEKTSRAANEGPQAHHPDEPKLPTPGPPPAAGPGDFPTPSNGNAVASPSRDAQSVCAKVAEFIGECNRDGWGSPQCREFLDGIKGCGDPKITDPVSPDRDCGLPAVDADKVQEVVLVLCTSKKQFGEGENPCGRVGPAGKANTYQYRPVQREGGIACNDPRAYFEGGSCLPTLTFATFGEPDIRQLLKEGFKKFGGPVFVIPLPPPGPNPEPGPEPRPVPK